MKRAQQTNPLITHAALMLSVANQLKQQNSEPNLKKLHQILIKEIQQFDDAVQKYGYRSNILIGARYMLCAMIDEVILTSAWGAKSSWQKNSLLVTFQYVYNDFARFFVITEGAMKEPAIYIDLLELAYLILSLGFKSGYSSKKDQDLDHLIDSLYELIKNERGDFDKTILEDSIKVSLKKQSSWSLPPIWLTLIVASIILAAIFFPYYRALNQLIKPMRQSLQINYSMLNLHQIVPSYQNKFAPPARGNNEPR